MPFLGLIVLVAAGAAADAPPPTPEPQAGIQAQEQAEPVVTPTEPPPARIVARDTPPPELEQLAVFEGRWTCHTTGQDGGPAQPSEITIRRDLDGFWYSGRAVLQAQRPITRLFFWSHDEVVGKFVGGFLDSGGGWSAQTAVGWEDDKLHFIGHVTATGQKVMARETWTRPTAEGFARRYEVLGFIEWTVIAEDRCRRASADHASADP